MSRDMNQQIACRAARFRAAGVKAPDAIHLATATVYKAECFVAEDSRLRKVEGVRGKGLSSFVR